MSVASSTDCNRKCEILHVNVQRIRSNDRSVFIVRRVWSEVAFQFVGDQRNRMSNKLSASSDYRSKHRMLFAYFEIVSSLSFCRGHTHDDNVDDRREIKARIWPSRQSYQLVRRTQHECCLCVCVPDNENGSRYSNHCSMFAFPWTAQRKKRKWKRKMLTARRRHDDQSWLLFR